MSPLHPEQDHYLTVLLHTASSCCVLKPLVCGMGHLSPAGGQTALGKEKVHSQFIPLSIANSKALEEASNMLHDILNNAGPTIPSRIIISADNTGTFQ